MSLDIKLTAVREVMVYDTNITHNLTDMAVAAGIYKHLWIPADIGITLAAQLVDPLTEGLSNLKGNPEKYSAYNSPNGWGMHEHFVKFVENYLEACRKNPDAIISVSR